MPLRAWARRPPLVAAGCLPTPMMTICLSLERPRQLAGDVLTFEDGCVAIWLKGEEVARLAIEELSAIELDLTVEAGQDGRAYTVADSRKEHPAAYARWSAEDDERLWSRHDAGATVPELMEEFGRGSGAVRSRLVKLALRRGNSLSA